MTRCVNYDIEVPGNEFCPECGSLCLAAEEDGTIAEKAPLVRGHKLIGKYVVEEMLQAGEAGS